MPSNRKAYVTLELFTDADIKELARTQTWEDIVQYRQPDAFGDIGGAVQLRVVSCKARAGRARWKSALPNQPEPQPAEKD